jgi:hypothetical protein
MFEPFFTKKGRWRLIYINQPPYEHVIGHKAQTVSQGLLRLQQDGVGHGGSAGPSTGLEV